MPYIYNDEDNSAMNGESLDPIEPDGHNPTVYLSYADMRAEEQKLPFEDPPENGCWNCIEFDGDRCHKDWNNNDEDYYVPWRDNKDPGDSCSDWERDESIKSWEEAYGGNDP